MERPEEITAAFLSELDKHIDDIVSGREIVFYEIHDFAAILCIHPTHLSNTVKKVTGKAPCDHCEGKLAVEAKHLLRNSRMTISEVAYLLTYDPPAFTRFFKKYVGVTPKQYRAVKPYRHSSNRTEQSTLPYLLHRRTGLSHCMLRRILDHLTLIG